MLQWHASYALHYPEDCHFLGVTPSGDWYVEEYYAGGFWAQHGYTSEGRLLSSADDGINAAAQPLSLPPDLIPPATLHAVRSLHYVGGRYRGLREAERLSDWVLSLPLMEKIPLVTALSGHLTLPQLVGIAESRVLAAAPLPQTGHYIVCRCVRLARLWSTPQIDSDGLPYDYDTFPLYIAHLYDANYDSAPPLHEALRGLANIRLHRPLDCIAHQDRVYLADGGDGQRLSRVVIYTVS
jgi:hypothetical protein